MTNGPAADAMVEAVREHGGVLSDEDLREYQPLWREPVRGTYRGYEVISMPPPSSGGVHVIQMLNALESKSDHSMPLEFFRDLLQQRFSDVEAQRQIETALNWGRYGDILNYDSERDRISLYHPAEMVKDE